MFDTSYFTSKALLIRGLSTSTSRIMRQPEAITPFTLASSINVLAGVEQGRLHRSNELACLHYCM
jgi:hypothetical protein